MPTRFELEFSPRALENLEQLRKHDQQIVVDAIEVQLRYEPAKPTGKRKKLADNPLAPWELRVREFRVFYDVATEQLVIIVAVGVKEHNRLTIGGEEIEL
jgi:mRNA-degrading endonuclease RelE of RelBE toxin-antitoxin system